MPTRDLLDEIKTKWNIPVTLPMAVPWGKDDVVWLVQEVERLRVLARAVDEFVSAAECQCCGGVPYCDHNIEKKAVNEKGRAMTEALRKVTP
jgi:hypothetical protein